MKQDGSALLLEVLHIQSSVPYRPENIYTDTKINITAQK